MKDLMMGTKQCRSLFLVNLFSVVDIKAVNVKYLSVPHYEGLSVDQFIDVIDNHEILKQYFPDKRDERKRLPRQFIINVIYTKIGEPFATMCKER